MWWPRKRPPGNDDRFSVVFEERHPTKCYRKGESRPESMEHCAVCLSRFQEGEAIRELRCTHVFHRDCVDKWLKQQHDHDHHLFLVHATCPLCRKSVFPEEMVVEHRRLQREQEISDEEEIVFMSSALYGF